MLKNLSYPIPTVGRISIGEIVDNGTRRLPKKLNHFRITAQHKRDGQWVEHPIAAVVAKKIGCEQDKITTIPVRVMFNNPDLIVRERFEAFEKSGSIVCAGNGEKARRQVGQKIEEVSCPGPDHCEFGKASRCDLMVRANFQINAEAEGFTNDEMSSFILRSRGFNTARTLNRKLNFYAKLFKGKLVGVPFDLKLRMKSTAMSMNTPFYYIDLVTAVPLREAAEIAKKTAEENAEIFDQDAFEAVAQEGFANGPFEDGTEEFAEIEEFLLESGESAPALAATNTGAPGSIHANMDQLRAVLEGQEQKRAA